MKQPWKKSLAVLLLVLLAAMPLLGLAESEIELPLIPERQTFTIMIRKSNMSKNNMADKEPVTWTEEHTNVVIDWIEVPESGWNEKISIMFASNDLPDCIIGPIDVVRNIPVLVPLGDIIDTYAPNIQRMFEDIPAMRPALTHTDGNIYSLPIGGGDPKDEVNEALWINKTWLENLGLEMPTTIDELNAVLIAFRDGDPNGNGIADEIPLCISNSNSDLSRFDSLFGSFGTLDNNDHIRVEDGKVIFTPSEDGFYEGLKWFNTLYTEKLMNQEYFTEQYQQYRAKGESDPCIIGVAKDWYKDNIITAKYLDDFVVLPPLEGTTDSPLWNINKLPMGTLNGFTITTACENPEVLVRWYDYINSNLDIHNLWNYGPEDVMWHYLEDGRWEVFTDNIPDGSSSSEVRRTVGVGPVAPVYAYARFRGVDVEKQAPRVEDKIEANEMYKLYAAPEQIPYGFDDPDNETERGLLLVDMDNYLKRFVAEAVTQGIDDAKWEAHLKTLESLRIDEYVQLWQNFYDSH